MNNNGSGPLNVALLGCGVVGSQVARLLLEESADLEARAGRPLELVGIGVQRARKRAGLDPELFTTDVATLLDRDDLDLVVELIGGIEPARTYILKAIAGGASVVTANKALLAEHGAELFEAAEKAGVDLYYEAAVAGAIPIIRPLRESLVGDAVTAVKGIVNGTTNYILDKMHTEGSTFAEALAEAQQLGYAEADPTADVEGYDAAAKAAILASLAFHTRVRLEDVARQGISDITTADIEGARDARCVIKLLANCRVSPDGTLAVDVHPTLVPREHPLASVSGAFNAIFVESRNAGQLMFMGSGAGGNPTASAVMGDVVTAARNRVRGVRGPHESAYQSPGMTERGAVTSRFHVSFAVDDTPGVLAQVATCFSQFGVSIRSVRQEQMAGGEGYKARLTIVTHTARVDALRSIVAELETMDSVADRVRVLRVEGA